MVYSFFFNQKRETENGRSPLNFNNYDKKCISETKKIGT